MDDEFAENILSYDLFLVWVGGIGAQTAFSWENDIRTSINAIYDGVDLSVIADNNISHIEYVKNEFDNQDLSLLVNEGVFPADKINYAWVTELSHDNAIVPALTVSSGNTIPVANAGSDASSVGATVLTLDGSGSVDADGDNITYLWTIASQPAGGTATLSGATTPTPTISTGEVTGDYVVSLVVRDTFSSSAADTVTITIT